jgi:phosphoribosylanthranilate isomerase
MREPDNIRAVCSLPVDMLGFIFYPKSPRYVKSISTHAGIIPNMSDHKVMEAVTTPRRVGVFVDEMPQTVITHAYNYKLDYLQLHGNESPIYIDNLRRTIIPDILPNIKIIKALSIASTSDLEKCAAYEGHVEMFLFDTQCKEYGGSGRQFNWDILQSYRGNIPFLLSGGIKPDDAQRIMDFHHPMMAGIDVNSGFEDEPGIKNIDKLREFITNIKNK